jgi:GNAT superfamily N-acetyltransferase
MVSAATAVSKIKNGSRVFIGTGCGEPQQLIRAMVAETSLHDIQIHQMLSDTLARYIDDPSFLRRFSLKLFFISFVMRRAAFEGKLDYLPAYLSQIPRLFSSRSIGLDVALVQVSPPDRWGYCSLGVSVDITRSGIDNSKLIIAQINPRMPRTLGDTFVHLDQIDYVVPFEETLIGFVSKGGHKEIMSIGSYAEGEHNRAEVAFVVREDYQRQGIGSHLLVALERIAVENGYRGFTATVLKENKGMIQVFQKRYPDATISWNGGDVEITMDFGVDTSSARQ